MDEEQMFSEDFVISFYTLFITIDREKERERERWRGELSNNYYLVFVYYIPSYPAGQSD